MNSPSSNTATLPQAIGEALQHHRAGRFRDAESIYRQVLKVDPEYFDALHLLGVLAHQTGRNDDALDLIKEAVQKDNTQPFAFNNLGEVYRALNHLDDAERCYRQALDLKPDYAEALNNLGNTLLDLGRAKDAEQAYRQALNFKPDYTEAYSNLCKALLDLGRPNEAEQACCQALALKPDCAEAHNNLGNALLDLGRPEKAEQCYRQALKLKPDYVEAYNNLGNALLDLGSLEKGMQAYHQALFLKPDYAEAYYNMGKGLQDFGELKAAEQAYRQALVLKNDYAMAQWNLSLLKLLQGDYEEGFNLFEKRFLGGDRKVFEKINSYLNQLREYCRWDGETLEDRSLLVIAEQGLGDNLMMIRYLPLISQMHPKHIVVYCEKPLKRIIQCLPGIDDVITMTEQLPFGRFDLYCPMMSLPYIFKTRLESVPRSVPYLFVPEDMKQRWRKRFADVPGIKVGLVWAGKKSYRENNSRSILLRQFSPLQEINGVQLVSLQKREEGKSEEPGWNLLDWMDECGDLLDTAALIEQLDLVVSVDTSIAHLAGALGKPVWLLNRFGSEWRWLLDREDSPWYPSMRIFRQEQRGDWDSVIKRLAIELELMINKTGELCTPNAPGELLESIFQTGLAHLEQRVYDAAISQFQKLLAMTSAEPAVWYNLGRAHRLKGKSADAEFCFQQVLLLEPESPPIWYSLGGLHLEREAFGEAEVCLRKAHAYAPDSVEILLKLGESLTKQKKLEESIDCCREILAIEPGHEQAAYNLAVLQLGSGDYMVGFDSFEMRLKRFQIDPRTYTQPRWDGSPLEGRSILVFGEQGMGDVIQFSRYLPLLAERGGKIIFEVDKPLVPLFTSLPNVAQVVQKSETPPLTDVYIQLLSLPRIFNTTLDTIPNRIPYITSDPSKAAAWRRMLAGDPLCRIGLVWQGNPRNPMDRDRSCPFSEFRCLLDIQGVSYYSIQVGPAHDDLNILPPEIRITDLTNSLADFSDTAALIANLDLVISVDTAVAHLAGAIGISVWVLLTYHSDWRWMENQEYSPWYHTMRLFRQEKSGEWGGVLERVKNALELLLSEKTN